MTIKKGEGERGDREMGKATRTGYQRGDMIWEGMDMGRSGLDTGKGDGIWKGEGMDKKIGERK